MTAIDTDTEISAIVLQHEVEQFLYREAALLDERRFDEWHALFTDDVHYWMPARSTRTAREIDGEFTKPGELAHFDEDKRSLGMRIKRLATGMAWAENPPSRTRHLVTNVRVKAGPTADEYRVTSSFLLYRTRLEREEDIFVGERRDTLRREAGDLRIAARTVILDQTVLTAKNLSVFF